MRGWRSISCRQNPARRQNPTGLKAVQMDAFLDERTHIRCPRTTKCAVLLDQSRNKTSENGLTRKLRERSLLKATDKPRASTPQSTDSCTPRLPFLRAERQY